MQTNDTTLTGKVMVRKGNDTQEPCVVYVRGWNSNFELWSTQKINTGDIYLSKEQDLLPYDNQDEFETMLYSWRIRQLKKTEANLLKLHKEAQNRWYETILAQGREINKKYNNDNTDSDND
jgi:hypothetical protein